MPPPTTPLPLPPAAPGAPRPLRSPAPRRPRRRGRALVAVLLAVAAVGVAFAVLLAAFIVVVIVGSARSERTNVGQVDLTHPLRIPPLHEGRMDAVGTRVYDLRFTPGQSELLPGRRTDTWGLNGTYLGPTLRARRGEKVRIDVTNGAGEDTTLHWHGMHLPAAMDGGPHQIVEPGATWSPAWTIDQPAATLWYHPHLHGRTAEQVERGAAGMFLLDDDTAGGLGLPDDYGVDDVPVIIQDRSFDDDGDFAGSGFLSGNGQIGDQILVNGTWGPLFEATTTQVRLRVLNASNTRLYNLGFTDGRRYAVVGSDSGLLPAPVDVDRLALAPGERAEILVPVRPGDDVVLRSFPVDLGLGLLEARSAGGDDTMDILRVRAAAQLDERRPAPAALVPADRATAPAGAPTRTFRFAGNTINLRQFDMHRIDATARLDQPEVWEVHALDGLHVFHLHDVRFRIIDIDGAPPPALLAGWKDTFHLTPGRRFRLLVRFEDYADANHGYMFHCHILRHEDQGMMGQVAVTP